MTVRATHAGYPIGGESEVSTNVSPVATGQLLRVALVGPSLDILGGQAVQLQRLRRRLAELPSLEVGFVPVNPRLPGPLRLLQSVKYLRTIVTSVRYVGGMLFSIPRYDIVHAFSASYWSFLLAPLPAMLIGRLFRRAVVLNYRSGEAGDHLARWRHVAIPAMRLADRIVVPSAYLVDVFAEFGLEAEAIFNFVEIERIPHRRRPTPRPIFLSNRNLEPLYNVGCVLQAFALIQRQVPEARLIVAGEGKERPALEALVARLGVRQVEFRGRTPPEEMAVLYDEADIYLNSPNIDNMPNSVIEAFAAGLPVVTTNAGGIPYIVDHERNGLLVKVGDHEALAAAALRMLREPRLAERLSDEGRRECLAKFVWPAVSADWERMYVDVRRRAAMRRIPDRGESRRIRR